VVVELSVGAVDGEFDVPTWIRMQETTRVRGIDVGIHAAGGTWLSISGAGGRLAADDAILFTRLPAGPPASGGAPVAFFSGHALSAQGFTAQVDDQLLLGTAKLRASSPQRPTLLISLPGESALGLYSVTATSGQIAAAPPSSSTLVLNGVAVLQLPKGSAAALPLLGLYLCGLRSPGRER